MSYMSPVVRTQPFIPNEKREGLRAVGCTLFDKSKSKTWSVWTGEQLFKKDEIALGWRIKDIFNRHCPKVTWKDGINFCYREVRTFMRLCTLSSENRRKIEIRVTQLMQEEFNGYCVFNDFQQKEIRRELKYSLVKTLSENRTVALFHKTFMKNYYTNLSPYLFTFVKHIQDYFNKEGIYPPLQSSEEFAQINIKYKEMLAQEKNEGPYWYLAHVRDKLKLQFNQAKVNEVNQQLNGLNEDWNQRIALKTLKLLENIYTLADSTLRDKIGQRAPTNEEMTAAYAVILSAMDNSLISHAIRIGEDYLLLKNDFSSAGAISCSYARTAFEHMCKEAKLVA